MFDGPDNDVIYDAEGEDPYPFFASGGAWTYGVRMTGIIMGRALPADLLPKLTDPKTPPQRMRLDTFLSQIVISVKGRRFSRGNVLKYVANVASGVHSGTPNEDEQILAWISQNIAYSASTRKVRLIDGIERHPLAGIAIAVNMKADEFFRHEPDRINPVLAEVLGAAHYLVLSPDFRKLTAAIHKEVSRPK